MYTFYYQGIDNILGGCGKPGSPQATFFVNEKGGVCGLISRSTKVLEIWEMEIMFLRKNNSGEI